MKHHKSQRAAAGVVLIVTTIAFAGPGLASYFPFRVAFENVPGIEQIESGNIEAGIEVLEQQLGQDSGNSRGDILATLCGAYVMMLSLEKARITCDEAVSSWPGDTAYNNRGVFRTFIGDFSGAREDFNRARPGRMDQYLEELRTRDVGLIADTNHGLLEELSARHTPDEVNTSVAVSTATATHVTD